MHPTIKEAHRYLANAKEILEEKAIRENGVYRDKKYVKLAGHAAYTGVLLALDQLMDPSGKQAKRKSRKSIDIYRSFLASYDRKMLDYLNNLYNVLHLDMSYDGTNDTRIIKSAMSVTKEFIDTIGARFN